jgi:hypothetical protein
VVAVQGARDPEVGDIRGVVRLQQYVRRLQVAMDDPGVMGVLEGLGDLPDDVDGPLHGQGRVLVHDRLERSTLPRTAW